MSGVTTGCGAGLHCEEEAGAAGGCGGQWAWRPLKELGGQEDSTGGASAESPQDPWGCCAQNGQEGGGGGESA